MARTYQRISGDSHLEISPERWTGRVPARYRDRAPRLVKMPDGGDGIMVENRKINVLGLHVTGRPYQEHRIVGMNFESEPGTGSPEQRLREQDRDGVDAEILFVSAAVPGLWRGIPDDAAYKAVIRAWNEFLGEEYCAEDRDRLIAMGLIPDTNVDDAIEELEYCAKVGLRAVSLISFPSGRAFPTPEDDRLWSHALAMNMPIAVHVGFLGRGQGPLFRYPRTPGEYIETFDPIRQLIRFGGSTGLNTVQLIMAGVFDRFPKLRIYWAETQAGWVPYFMEQFDDTYERIRYWAERDFGLEPLPRPPSAYVRDNFLWGFLRDPIGVRLRHEVGVRTMLWGNDFPHAAGDWPDSDAVLEELFQGVPSKEQHLIVAGNAVEFFHLEDQG